MAELVLFEINSTGVEPEAVDVAVAAGGDSYANDDRTILFILNGNAGSLTVTIPRQRTTVRKEGFGELTILDIAVVVATMTRRLIKAPPFSHSDANGKAQVTYSLSVSVTAAALRLRRD